MLVTRNGKDCCGEKLDYANQSYKVLCMRDKGHRGQHESMLWKAEHMDAFDHGADAMKKSVLEYLRTHGWFLAGQAKASIEALPYPEPQLPLED